MSHERRINDHSSWMGKGNKGSILPAESKTKQEMSASDAGELNFYPDTTDKIKKVQDHGASKANGHKMKDGYRN